MRKWMTGLLVFALLALACAPALGVGEPGTPMPDFTVQTIDGGAFTLSEALETHDMVLVNFWATWCQFCTLEFPYLQEAYAQYGDRVAVIALSVEPTDTPEVLRAYAEEQGLTFPIGNCASESIASLAPTLPTSVVVDRFGNIALKEAGAQDSTAKFAGLFEYFLAEDYDRTTVLDKFPPLRPNVTPADGAALGRAANAAGSALDFRNSGDSAVWPMLPAEIDGREALVSTNAGVDATRSEVRFTVSAAGGDALAFDFKTSLEPFFDALFVEIDGSCVRRFTGGHDWTPWAVPLPEGDHEIAVGCAKDNASGGGEDRVWIDEVRLVSGEEAAALLAALPPRPVSEAFAAAVANDGARKVAFDDPDGVIRGSFGAETGWIVGGDAATVAVSLTAQQDPETAFIATLDDQYGLFDALNAEGTGYSVTVPLGERGYNVLLPYPGTDQASRTQLASEMIFADEAGADAFLAYLRSYGYEAGWHYADGEALQ